MPHSGSSRSVERGFASLPKVVKLISQWPLFLALTLPGLNQACGPYGGGPTPGKTTPTITWATPAAITYGTALSSTQLDATASVPGTFTYTPAASTVLTAGTQTLSVSFAPTDTTHYNSASATVSLTVNKAAPTITWATPAAIAVGAALSATQLDATASVAGTFAYNPASGTVPAAGTQTLSVTFTPTDSTDYTTATDSVSLTVNAVSGSGRDLAERQVHRHPPCPDAGCRVPPGSCRAGVQGPRFQRQAHPRSVREATADRDHVARELRRVRRLQLPVAARLAVGRAAAGRHAQDPELEPVLQAVHVRQAQPRVDAVHLRPGER